MTLYDPSLEKDNCGKHTSTHSEREASYKLVQTAISAPALTSQEFRSLYDSEHEYSSCGVGFITDKTGEQTHQLLALAHQALCTIPHRGGMNAEGIGDGAGVNIDLSVNFYRFLLEQPSLEKGEFGVANFFFPFDNSQFDTAKSLIESTLSKHKLGIALWREVPVNTDAVNEASQQVQQTIQQVIFLNREPRNHVEFEDDINLSLSELESIGFTDDNLEGFYPLSMSSKTQVYKGRLNSWEVVPYFADLSHPEHQITTLFFHTRFSTNTAPATMMAQPFRRMAHNGELNTDKKNRLSEDAIARQQHKKVIFPKGQSDSARLDQTLARRVVEDRLDIVTAVLAMMPPAWENDEKISPEVRAMLEYFSLSEEKNDGPAALIFSDGQKVGARLDRLGLRPLRSVETDRYLAVMSEAGQIDFPAEEVIRYGRIQAGGMIYFDHGTGKSYETNEILETLAKERNYSALLESARITLDDLAPSSLDDVTENTEFSSYSRQVAYSLNQESFKFFLDPMIEHGAEKITAMGFGLAPNVLTDEEGGMSKYFSQRFAQVTNPPLDSLRESDGMTLRVALGAKPNFSPQDTVQLVLDSPILQPQQLEQIFAQDRIDVTTFDTLFTPTLNSREDNAKRVAQAINDLCDAVQQAAEQQCGIVVLSDKNIANDKAALPAVLVVTAVNQRLIKKGLRFDTSIVYQTGQAVSSHDIACLLGFGASAICPMSVFHRAKTLSNNQPVETGLKNFQKACEKSLMKTMGKFGLCTAESYIGGEFFESNFLDTDSPCLKKYFPNISSPVGGARFEDLAWSSAKWHFKALAINEENQIPLLGLFKERQDGAGHSFGNTAVREYINMTQESVQYVDENQAEQALESAVVTSEDIAYKEQGYDKLTPEQIDNFKVTPSYRSFASSLYSERESRPAALRDILLLPLDFTAASTPEEFSHLLDRFHFDGNVNYLWAGLQVTSLSVEEGRFQLQLNNVEASEALHTAIKSTWAEKIVSASLESHHISLEVKPELGQFLARIKAAKQPIEISQVEAAHLITPTFASGAMSHGALNANAHQAVAQGTNIAGAMSNSGEGGEHSTRFNTIKASKIKQFASGRFGVWVGYLADPQLEEIEIKIAQGAKPGEGGQLPSPKVTVEIAAARGGTPGVELVSPPPHHDTYSIEDLGQLIHDAKAARVRVIVKLVSSEGIGTIAVGVAKAGADVINVAGNTGGTGAAAVTSLKNTGRAAEIGIAEVHQSLSENGLRDKVTLRCSNAHQTGADVIKSAIMGGDSFEFGTTALMMLKCVMAKNCNVKCPAGLTTNPELYQGDPRALAQYFLNVAHEVREILAKLGYRTLRDIRGKTELLHLANHHSIVGRLDVTGLLRPVDIVKVAKPIYLEADFTPDDHLIETLLSDYFESEQRHITLDAGKLNNRNKSTGGQLSIDIERGLNYQNIASNHPAVLLASNGRRFLDSESVLIKSNGSAGQSYAAFNNSGLVMEHTGTCNDGVGKGASGGHIVVRFPGQDQLTSGNNVLIGNFALFGATGGQAFIEGEAGDRFAVRNSGAVAVVEGVGDFCCEYMTNGSVINLGGYGKGFGNGMSGGVAYQYNVDGNFANSCSKDSVLTLPLIEHNPGYEEALKWHLEQHVRFTQSAQAKAILADWATSRTLFTLVLPLALTQSQHPESILASHSRKKMQEELIHGEANRLLEEIHFAYRDEQVLSDGLSPQYGEMDTSLICDLLTQSGVLHRAHELAKTQVPDEDEQAKLVTRMFELRDKKLLDTVTKDVKEAISTYKDEELAVLLAHKRVQDYKTSLARRDVWDTHSRGTSVWILARELDIRSQLTEIEALNQRLATLYCHAFADVIRDDIEQEKALEKQAEKEAQTA